MASPIEQFQITPLIPFINFTNSSLFMLGTTAVIVRVGQFCATAGCDSDAAIAIAAPRP